VVLSINEILEKLADDDPVAAEVARLRLFAGSSVEEAGEAIGLSRASAYREWTYAQAMLSAGLADERNSRKS
ncbi:MAG TPA: ECF-type sigma factor, partial [Planctomycetia bacterium]|nr:ECF-type sigma factor [Planctomycetia bacterium]